MPFKLLLTLLLILSFSANAQNAFLFRTQEDFLNNKPTRAEVSVKKRTYDDGEWAGPGIYKIIVPGNTKFTEDIRDYYFAVEYHDSLFLNCLPRINVAGYANVLLRGNNYLYFNTIGSKLYEHRKQVRKGNKNRHTDQQDAALFAGVMGGAIGGAIAGAVTSNTSTKGFNYLYDMNTIVVDILTPEVLKKMLQKRPDLLDLYIKTNTPDDDGTYYWYLSKLFELE